MSLSAQPSSCDAIAKAAADGFAGGGIASIFDRIMKQSCDRLIFRSRVFQSYTSSTQQMSDIRHTRALADLSCVQLSSIDEGFRKTV